MNSNVFDPTMIKELVEYATALPDSTLMSVRTSVLIHVSSLVRRFCILEDDRSQFYPMSLFRDSEQCQDATVKYYSNYLRNKFKNSRKSYEKAVYIQAMANLGDQSTTELLTKIASSETSNEVFRLLAIKGLTNSHVLNTTIEQVSGVLTAIIESQTQRDVLREAAVYSLFSFPQNASAWQRVAQLTWRDPSPRVADYIYRFIRTVAGTEHDRYAFKIANAKFALASAKPVPYTSFSSSNYLAFTGSNIQDNIGYAHEFAYNMGNSTVMPQAMMAKITTALGGLKFPLMKLSSIGLGSGVVKHLLGLASEKSPAANFPYTNMHAQMDELTNEMGNHDLRFFKDEIVHLSLMENSQFFVPATEEYFDEVLPTEMKSVDSTLRDISAGRSLETVRYHNFVDMFQMFPSDIGLPVISKSSRSLFSYGSFSGKLTPAVTSWRDLRSSTSAKLEGNFLQKIVVKSDTSLEVSVPFAKKTVSVNIEGETSLNMHFRAKVETESPIGAKIVSITLTPNITTSKTPVMLTKLQPLTVLKPLHAAILLERSLGEFKPINQGSRGPLYKDNIQYHGLFDVEYEGDIKIKLIKSMPDLIKKGNMYLIYKLLAGPSVKQYQIGLFAHPGLSIKTIKTDFVLAMPGGRRAHDMEDNPLIQDLSVADSLEQRLRKVRRSSAMGIASAAVEVSGRSEKTSKFEFAALAYPSQEMQGASVSYKKFTWQMNFMKLVGNKQPQQTCVVSSFKYPEIKTIQPVSEILSQSLSSEFLSSIYQGQQCSAHNQILSVKSFAEMSSERRARFQRHFSAEGQSLPSGRTEGQRLKSFYDRFNMEVAVLTVTISMLKCVKKSVQ